jgi:hypothetical protein
MKLTWVCSLVLIIAMASGPAPIASQAAAAAVAREIGGRLLQGSQEIFCDPSQPFNFYMAPGFGCILSAPPCSGIASWQLARESLTLQESLLFKTTDMQPQASLRSGMNHRSCVV